MFDISELHKMLTFIKSQTVFVQITTDQCFFDLADIKENGIVHKTK